MLNLNMTIITGIWFESLIANPTRIHCANYALILWKGNRNHIKNCLKESPINIKSKGKIRQNWWSVSTHGVWRCVAVTCPAALLTLAICAHLRARGQLKFLFLYRNHVHKNNSPRSGRAVYYEVILMCWCGLCAGNLELVFCSSGLEEINRLTRDQPPLKQSDLWLLGDVTW